MVKYKAKRKSIEGCRYGLKAGDIVQPTEDYLKEVNSEGFKSILGKHFMKATIARFPYDDDFADLAVLALEGEKYEITVTAYWLEKFDPCKTCPLGIDKVCVSAE